MRCSKAKIGCITKGFFTIVIQPIFLLKEVTFLQLSLLVFLVNSKKAL